MAANTRVAPVADETTYKFQWTGIIAGAICASALAFVLHAFAGAIGISLSSTAPTWRDSSGCVGSFGWVLPYFGGLSLLRLWCLRGRASSSSITNHTAGNCRISRRRRRTTCMGIGYFADGLDRPGCRSSNFPNSRTLRHLR